ncbi:GTPase [Clostridium grantii]|uniref:Flagellar biosynthesis protein FlhF n=1 Tax=Clostridium grantii DSM 8605 TaxID=1121316 RepID=A0A1M5XIV7_9CLOT|nr:flagellar biosynthesis protein FlhF [Clostridium grantii]SHH99741.1 flagellar biosynthesis protein FlhF [Clostridium grantii DSM 8605]
MIVKKYVVSNMQEAMIRIRMDLGDKAVIISDHYIKNKGPLGFMKKKKREVIAAVDEEEISKSKESKNKYEKKESGNEIEDLLELSDLSKEIQKEFIEYCNEHKLEKANINKFVLNEFLWEEVKNNVVINENIDNKIISFIGPTGVGKTTTIAKIAAKESLVNNKKVALITLDTYRIGAVEQLKTYADILNIPLEVVVKKEDMKKAIQKFNKYDLILIDSTGRSFKNDDQINEIKEYMDEIKEKSVYLVLSLTTKFKDIKGIADSYEQIGYDKYILTKLDESSGYGNIINIAKYIDKPISYLCTGQNVPDDIETASIDKLFYYIWGEIRS